MERTIFAEISKNFAKLLYRSENNFISLSK